MSQPPAAAPDQSPSTTRETQAETREAEPPPDARPTAEEAALPTIDSDDERPVPDYDGRGDDPTTPGEVLIWVPRLALSPLYLVSEFVVRRPLGAFVSWAEEEHVPEMVVDLFTFGPERNAGVIPTGLLDFGMRPSIGLYFFWNEWIPQNHFRARAATWGPDWLSLNVRNRIELTEDDRFSIAAGFTKRPDWVFHGLGPASPDAEHRFSATTLEASLGYEMALWRRSNFRSFVGVSSTEFKADLGCCSDPTVQAGINSGRLAEPAGLADGYTLLRAGIHADIDTRQLRQPAELPEGSDYMPAAGSGVRLNLRGEHDAGIGRHRPFATSAPERYQFVRYGGTLTGFLDMTGEQRVVSLSAIVDFADPLREDGNIPFTELVSLGGERPMRGFLQGRLLDRSSAVARLDYTWPIWIWLDGTLQYEVGNVFGEHLEGFELGLLRNSFGLGMRGTSSVDHVFEILLAFGTETFDDGSQIENVRFVFGATSGF